MGQRKFRDLATFNIRMQPALRKQIEDAATGKVKWSLNSEINQRLEESFRARGALEQYSDGELIDELIRRWGRDGVFIHLGIAPPKK